MASIEERLQAPFSAKDIEWRIGSTNGDKTRGLALAYVTNRAIQRRLDEVLGCFGWRNEYRDWKGKGVLCGLSLEFEGEWITKWDGADETDFEPTKGGLSDAMKRAAYQWGIGRYLYELEAVWVPIKQVGKSYVLAEVPPRLPNWALPAEEQAIGNGGQRQPTQQQPPPQQPPQSENKTPPITADKVYIIASDRGVKDKSDVKLLVGYLLKRDAPESMKELSVDELQLAYDGFKNATQAAVLKVLAKLKAARDSAGAA